MEKLNLRQQKHAFANQKKCATTQKTKARFHRLLRHPAWKWRRPILVLAIHKSVTDVLTYLDTYSLAAPGSTRGTYIFSLAFQ